jgi:hypothetical protein
LIVDIVQKPIAIDSLMAKVAQSILKWKWVLQQSPLFCCA